MELKWSRETCRLDELESKFKLPCVVKINEGFYTESTSNGFSQGDIIGIDQKMIIHNISANFVKTYEADKPKLNDKEILVPLNYNRKVKIVQKSKTYYSMQDLILDFPRYAEAGQDLLVTNDDDETLVVHAGERIELERLLPGSSGEPDSLVIRFVHEGDPVEAKLCTTTKGVFKTLPDDNEYTLADVVERLELPQIVSFVDGDVQNKCTQDLVEGIVKMVSISGRIQINRLVTQTVLVGHLQPIGQLQNDKGRFRKKTHIALPLDHPGIRDTSVTVSQNYDYYDRIYEGFLLVKNLSEDMQIINTLHVEFKREFSKPRTSTSESSNENKKRKPKVAPKPIIASKKPLSTAKCQSPTPELPKDKVSVDGIQGDDLSKTPAPPRPPPVEWQKVDAVYYLVPQEPSLIKKDNLTSSSSNDDYEEYDDFVQSLEKSKVVIKNENLPKGSNEHCKGDVVVKEKGCALTKDPLESNDSENKSLLKFIRKGLTKAKSHSFPKKTGLQVERQLSLDNSFEERSCNDRGGTRSSKAMVKTSALLDVGDVGENIGTFYDDIDECNMLSDEAINKASRNLNSNECGLKNFFNDLRCVELVNELNRVKLFDLAELCKKEQLDGKFFEMVSDEELKNAFNLKNADEFQRFRKLRSDR
ncbi:uncharacterized protein LOC128214747 isoform X2 [Mya arenaria]|uniref:uncharacterized protein LOC128214747 isoform X2 n=1 Tax=Mya arenaria TaxID=6604 RepID=UPI0022E6E685|nr:uncharacterized protein LOC128214747 isoform X2 [Mya arenaria]